MRDTAVARASDDFYPRDEASSTPHIGACAFNSVFLGALVQPDWDMFHSRHPAAVMHATARAISGAGWLAPAKLRVCLSCAKGFGVSCTPPLQQPQVLMGFSQALFFSVL